MRHGSELENKNVDYRTTNRSPLLEGPLKEMCQTHGRRRCLFCTRGTGRQNSHVGPEVRLTRSTQPSDIFFSKMKAFSFILVIVTAVGGGASAECLNFTDYNITFHSRNFECIWKWDEEHKLPPGTLYNVQYKKYGVKHWTDKSECQNITARFCNLTHEMTNEIETLNYDQYIVRVKAQSKNCTSDWVQSKRISVRDYTVIGPPSWSYISSIYSIKFVVEPPHAFIESKDGSLKTIEVFYSMPIQYHLRISSRDTRQLISFVQTDKEFEVSGLDPDTAYNGTIDMFLETGKNSEIMTFLVRTLPGNTWAFVVAGVLISIVLLSLAILWFSYIYVHPTRQLPKSLDARTVTSVHTMNLMLDENITSYIHGFSKPSNSMSLFSTSKVKLNLNESLMQSPTLSYQEGQYKSQVTRSTSNSSTLSSEQTNLTPVSSLSQETQTSLLDCGSRNSSMTYGICTEEMSSDKKNTPSTNPMITSIVQWDNNPSYRSQTESPPTYPTESTASWIAWPQASRLAPHIDNRDAELPFESGQLFQPPLLPQEKAHGESHMLFPFLADGHDLASNLDLGRYRPQATISFSLLSSVQVTDNINSDSELDAAQFHLHPRVEGDISVDDHLVDHTMQTLLSKVEPLFCQYRPNV